MTDTETMVMTVTEVANFLRLAESTVYKLAQEGKLPGRKIGGAWRFSREQVEALLALPDDDSDPKRGSMSEQEEQQ